MGAVRNLLWSPPSALRGSERSESVGLEGTNSSSTTEPSSSRLSIVDAIQREETLKQWVWRWKLNLIESQNPDWQDLGEEAVHG